MSNFDKIKKKFQLISHITIDKTNIRSQVDEIK